jgi:hypothetical protein
VTDFTPKAPAGDRARRGHVFLSTLASLALLFAVFAAPFAVSGVSFRSTSLLLLHAVIFHVVPGLAVMSCVRWLQGEPALAAIWALATGMALQPLWLTPLWMGGAVGASWLVPLAAILVCVRQRERIASYWRSELRGRSGRRQLATAALIGLFAGVGAWLGAMHPFATIPIDPHFGTQGSIVRNLEDGWPPMNQLLEGVPLSYNYAVHLGLMLIAAFWSIDVVDLVARMAPLLFLAVAILVAMAFARTVLHLRWRFAVLAATSIFWVVGYGPVNAAIYGSVLPSASVYAVSSLGAFIVFFVALRFLSERLADALSWRDALVMAALSFSITACRGQGGVILTCVVAFLLLPPLVRERRIDAARVQLLVGTVAGMLLALRIFLTLGSGFSGTSFIEVSGQTFTWLASQNAFSVVEYLKGRGASAWTAGAAGFLVIALMQAKFLAPAFVYQCARMRRQLPAAEYLLIGATIAGICGTMLTTAPGGSHFSFLHYATLSMSLLGAVGFARIAERIATRRGGSRDIIPLAAAGLVILLVTPSAWDLGKQLYRLRGHLFAGAPVLHSKAEVDPLLARLRKDDLVLPLLKAADQVPGIEAEWGMVYGVRFITYGALLHEYVGWRNRLQPSLDRRMSAAMRLEGSAREGLLDSADLERIAGTLAQPVSRLFVLAPAGLRVIGSGDMREIARTRSYVLHAFIPAANATPR